MLADQRVDAGERDVEAEIFDRRGVDVGDVARNLAPGQLPHQQGGTLGGIDLHIGIDTALETERRTGVQAEALGGFAHPYGVEIGALDEDVYKRQAPA